MRSTHGIRRALSFQNAVVLSCLIVLANIAMSIFLEGHLPLRSALNDLISFLLNAIAAVSLYYASRRSEKYGRRVQMAWSALAVAQLSFALGDLAFMILDVYLREPLFPSVADGFYLLFYPLFLMGILLLPSDPYTPSERFKIILDAGVVLIGSSLIFWSLLIAPTITASVDTDILTETISVAYPVMDLVLLFALVELIFRRLKSPRQGPLLLLAAGILAMISTDTVYMSQAISGTYESGGLLDTGWIINYLIFFLAGVLQSEVLPQGSPWKRLDSSYHQFTWPFYLPYICLGSTFILLIWSHDNEMPVSFSTMSLSVGCIIGLLIVRQITALNENTRLYRATLNEVAVRKKAEEAIRMLNEELEERVQSRTMALKSANDDLQKEIIERNRAEDELHKRDTLLSGVAVASNLLLTMPDYDSGLGQALEIIGLAADVDRVQIFESVDDGCFSCHRFQWVKALPQDGARASMDFPTDIPMPRWRSILEPGKPIRCLVADLPKAEMQAWRRMGAISIMAIPVHIRGQFWGFVSFCDCHSEHIWAEWESSILSAFASSIGGLIIRKKAEDVLKASVREKEVLLKEVHHRVKNNMQVISSLLSIQSRYINDACAYESFMESRSRIRSMALVHETLYRSNDLAKIDFAQYLRGLIRHLQSFYVSSQGITFAVDIDAISLDIEKAVPCGLIVNELVTNCIKYAFPASRRGEIIIELHSPDGLNAEMTIKDNGVGLPEDLDVKKTKSMGLKLVSALVKQLNGTMVIHCNGGAEFKIVFSLADCDISRGCDAGQRDSLQIQS